MILSLLVLPESRCYSVSPLIKSSIVSDNFNLFVNIIRLVIIYLSLVKLILIQLIEADEIM